MKVRSNRYVTHVPLEYGALHALIVFVVQLLSRDSKREKDEGGHEGKREKKCGSGKLSECFAFARTAYRIRVKVWLFYQRWKRSNQVCSLVVNLRDANPREEELSKDLSAMSNEKKKKFCCTMSNDGRYDFFFSFLVFTIIFDVNRFPLG